MVDFKKAEPYPMNCMKTAIIVNKPIDILLFLILASRNIILK